MVVSKRKSLAGINGIPLEQDQRFVLKQHNNRLAMTVRNVKDIEDGYKTLQQL